MSSITAKQQKKSKSGLKKNIDPLVNLFSNEVIILFFNKIENVIGPSKA